MKRLFTYSERFGQWGSKTIPYPVYTKDTKEKTSIVYFKGHKTRGIYPVPNVYWCLECCRNIY